MKPFNQKNRTINELKLNETSERSYSPMVDLQVASPSKTEIVAKKKRQLTTTWKSPKRQEAAHKKNAAPHKRSTFNNYHR